ncbi:hypothetical protein NQ117_03565 [Paenibacillus sp. SC116]|nr:hypothetical protein [Paenibacillus sp. SC116]
MQHGRDYIIRLSGGTHMHHHHIGAVSTAYYAEPIVESVSKDHNRDATDTCRAEKEISISINHKDFITSKNPDPSDSQDVALTHSSSQMYAMTHVVPGHKEAVLSEPMAMEAAKMLRTTVTVIAGIHYEQLQKHEIDQVVEAAWHVFRKALSHAL